MAGGRTVQGTGTATNAAPNGTIIGAPNTGKKISLRKAVVSVSTAAIGGGGLVKLEDGSGGAALFTADADAVGVYNIDFGEEGYELSAATLLNLTVDSALTTQATAFCTAVAEVN